MHLWYVCKFPHKVMEHVVLPLWIWIIVVLSAGCIWRPLVVLPDIRKA
jgi:hypothetical protein